MERYFMEITGAPSGQIVTADYALDTDGKVMKDRHAASHLHPVVAAGRDLVDVITQLSPDQSWTVKYNGYEVSVKPVRK